MSHGHPVTSGIPKHTMDYYISWAAAESPAAESPAAESFTAESSAAESPAAKGRRQPQGHYTEELLLLPASTMHQYCQSLHLLCSALLCSTLLLLALLTLLTLPTLLPTLLI